MRELPRGHDHPAGAGERRVRDPPAGGDAALREHYDFYVWDEATGEVRWMCSWDTTEEDVDTFARAVAEVLA